MVTLILISLLWCSVMLNVVLTASGHRWMRHAYHQRRRAEKAEALRIDELMARSPVWTTDDVKFMRDLGR